MNQTKTIGVLAHVDAGKTTFAEQLLYHTKSIKQKGRVDHKNSFLDSHNIEKERGITIFADQAHMSFNGSNYYLIDTPGHIDFSPEMERAIQIMDYAIIIISAVEGVEGHTETVWHLLKKYQVPTFFFINKIDRVGANVKKVIEDIRTNLTKNVCDITETFGQGELNEELVEFLAERNEILLEKYMEEEIDQDLFLNTMKMMIKRNELFPCASGSALQDIGIKEFLGKFDRLTDTNYRNDESFSGRVYKIRYDDTTGARITFIKALSGTLKVRDEICYGLDDSRRICEKVTQIRMYNGQKYEPVSQAHAGDLFAVTALSNAKIGDGLGLLKEKAIYELIPTLKAKVTFPKEKNIKDVLKHFQMLETEDPSLQVIWDEKFQEISIHVMGAIQLEVLTQIVYERFAYEVSFGEPEILYKETIKTQSVGYGHFEPLRHYAEVHLKLEPGERNSGIVFENACHPDHLSISYQNLVHQHLFERDHHGILTGSPLTDVKVTLLTGRAHYKHTSGGDFREGTFRALRQGLEKCENILLEPYYDLKIKVDLNHLGRIMSDIQSAHGTVHPPETIGNYATITGSVPVSTFMKYPTVFASFTKGKGMLNLIFSGYQCCHNQDEVITRIRYNKNADPDYSSSSIFCAKGQGYSVPWDEVEDNMHCL